MTISDRFVLFMREKGINQKDFAEKTGYLRQSLSKFITGNVKSPKIDLILTVMTHYPELNIDWLLMGNGDMWHKDYVKSGKKKEDVSVPADGLVVLGTGSNTELVKELFETKEKLLEVQQKRIEQLEQELKRLKEKYGEE